MDTSKQYIEMCRRATEIQQAWEHTMGDWFFRPGVPDSLIVACGENHTNDENKPAMALPVAWPSIFPEDDLWLPRQDQLQEMVENTGRVAKPQFYLVDDIHNFYFDGNQGLDTMEQLWLAAVMDWKFGKQWNGADWITKASH